MNHLRQLFTTHIAGGLLLSAKTHAQLAKAIKNRKTLSRLEDECFP
jgi:hypothetical protein